MSQVTAPTLRPRSKLTAWEDAFVDLFVTTAKLDGALAVKLAGHEGTTTDCAREAWRLLAIPRVRSAIDRRSSKFVAGRRRILGELSEVATAPWKDFITVKTDDEGQTISVTLDLKDKLKAADLLLKATGAYTDQLTQALGKLAMIEVHRMLRAKRIAARKARLSRRHPKLLAQGSTPPVVDEVEAEVVQPDAQGKAGKATEDE